jgi:hypothetical protein
VSPPGLCDEDPDESIVHTQVEQVMAAFRRRTPGGEPRADDHPEKPPVSPPAGLPPFTGRVDGDSAAVDLASRRRARAQGVVVTVRDGSPGPEGHPHGDLLNFSADGLGVVLRVPVLIGGEVTLELSRPGTTWLLRLVGEVRWCRPAPGETYQAGVHLHRRLTADELSGLSG